METKGHENVSDVQNDDNPRGVTGEDQLAENETRENVKYDTYKRTLSQYKKSKAENDELKARLEEIERKEREAEEQRLSEQGEYKKLLDMERKRLKELEDERNGYRQNLVDAHKLNAFKEKLPGAVKNPEYYSFVPVDKIAVDPETGLVDENSVEEVVSEFIEKHGSLFKPHHAASLPNNAPGSPTRSLSIEEWRKLPLKERKERMKDVYKANS